MQDEHCRIRSNNTNNINTNTSSNNNTLVGQNVLSEDFDEETESETVSKIIIEEQAEVRWLANVNNDAKSKITNNMQSQ